MPYKAEKDTDACPISKPWACKSSDTGKVHGCHATKADAMKQVRALYKNAPPSKEKKGGARTGTMERYPQIVRAITGTPWLIVPDNFQALLDIVNAHLNDESFTEEEIQMRIKAAEDSERENPRIQKDGGVGVVSIAGPMFPKANLMTMLSGATSLDMFANDLREMVADDDVKQVVIDFNTPGGTSDMVEETGVLIRELREQKPILGIANTFAGSGGLWLLSQCSKAFATPSGKVGSLGVYTAHEDRSAEDAKLGRKITLVHAGRYKTALSPHEPLSKEAREYLQEQVDELEQEFISQVAIGRGITPDYVAENFGEGKMFSARKAKEVGMVDEVLSMDDLLGQLVSENAAKKSVVATTALARHVQALHASMEESPLNIESKEWEHSEPGTGSPPVPRSDGDGSDEPDRKEGWRRNDLPTGFPDTTKNNTSSKEGGKIVDERIERELLRMFDVDPDNADGLLEAVRLKFGEFDELKKSVSAASQEQEFAEKYPQFWDQHTQLMKSQRETAGKTFADHISKLRKAEGNGLRETRMGLSMKAMDTVAETHIKFAEGKGTVADFEFCLKTIVNGGVLQFGEVGSSAGGDDANRIPDIDTSNATGIAANRQLFADIVARVQAANPDWDYIKCVEEASKNHPDIAEAYAVALPA